MRAEDLTEQIEAGETIGGFVQEERNDLLGRLRVHKALIEKARKVQDFIDAKIFSLEREVEKLQFFRQFEMIEMTDADRADAEKKLEEEAKNKTTTM